MIEGLVHNWVNLKQFTKELKIYCRVLEVGKQAHMKVAQDIWEKNETFQRLS